MMKKKDLEKTQLECRKVWEALQKFRDFYHSLPDPESYEPEKDNEGDFERAIGSYYVVHSTLSELSMSVHNIRDLFRQTEAALEILKTEGNQKYIEDMLTKLYPEWNMIDE